jgi:peptide/nickel transport system substrate-binding protein
MESSTVKDKTCCLTVIVLLFGMFSTLIDNHAVEKTSHVGSGLSKLGLDGNQTTPKYGGTLRIGMGTMPGNLNPLLDFGSAWWYPTMQVARNIFGRLIGFNETGWAIPDLAESWEFSGIGNRNCTFHLFHNVTWHDSAKFNASDVKFTFDTILYNPELCSIWWDLLQECNVSSIETLDEYTVIFTLHSPSASIVNKLGWFPIIPAHLYEGTNLATNSHNNNPIGTGPFKFVAWNPGVNITLQANEMYHMGRPYLDGVIIERVTNATLLTDLLLDNTIDIIPYSVDPARIEELSQVTGVSILNCERADFYYIDFNYSNPILADVRVRRALACAINRSAICEIPYQGYAFPAKGPIPPVCSYWHNANTSEYDYNPMLAEQLLDEAGYPRSNESNVRLNLNFSINGSYASRPWTWAAFEMMCSYFQDIGVSTTVQIYKPVNTTGPNLSLQDCRFMGWTWDFNDPDDLAYRYHTNAIDNDGGYSNVQVDYLLDQGKATFDQQLRKQIYDELQVLLSEDLPDIYLYYPMGVTAYNNDFHGFAEHWFGQIDPFVLERVWYDPALSGEGNCPMLVSFVDSAGRRSGYDPSTGQTVLEIPGSTYSGLHSDPQLVKIRSPLGNYTIELYGTGNGSYSLEIVNIALGYKNVNVPAANIHFNQTRKYYVRVIPDGSIFVFDAQTDVYEDGVIEMMDFYYTSLAYLSSPGHPNWNPRADVNSDDIVELMDFFIMAQHYLEHEP